MGRAWKPEDEARHLKVLIVEDEVIIALDLEAQLTSEGFDVVALAANVDTALRLLARSTPEAAILDLNIGHQLVTPVAEALNDKGIPFVVITAAGQGLKDELRNTPAFRDAPFLGKPATLPQITEALESLMTA
jgi:DNA-binding NtrC family response regulator